MSFSFCSRFAAFWPLSSGLSPCGHDLAAAVSGERPRPGTPGLAAGEHPPSGLLQTVEASWQPQGAASYALLSLSKASGSGARDTPVAPAASNYAEAKPEALGAEQERLWWIPGECGSRPSTFPSPPATAACPFTWRAPALPSPPPNWG